MDFSQIRYFLNLAETLNFTEAARLSGVSQPALTRAIQRLEEELGSVLIYRDGKATRLTAVGREIREEFSSIARSEERILASLENRVRGKREVLNLGLVHSLAPSFLGRFVNHVLIQLPMLEIVLHPIDRANAANLVLAGTLDGAFVSDSVEQNPKLSIQCLFDERLYLALGSDHRLASNETVAMKELAQEAYIDRLGCEFRERIAEQLSAEGVMLTSRLRSEREDLVQQIVADGAGVSFLPEFSGIVHGVALRPVEGINLSRQVCFVSISGSGNQMALRQLRSMLDRHPWPAPSEA